MIHLSSKRFMLYLTSDSFLSGATLSLMLILAINKVSERALILSRELFRKYANLTHVLSANLNCTPTVDLKPLSTERFHSQEHFSPLGNSSKTVKECLRKTICNQVPSLLL